MGRALWGALLPLLLCGCKGGVESDSGGGGGGSGANFDFATFRDVEIAVQVNAEGSGRRGVAVTVMDVREFDDGDDSETQAGSLYFRGLTRSDGLITGTFRVPTSVEEIDIIVQEPGYTGEWTDTDLQDQLGPFAPSARVTRTVSDSVSVTLNLEADT